LSHILTVFARLAVDPFERDVVLIPGSEALRDPARGGANIVIPLRVGSGVRHHGSLVQVGHRCVSPSFDLCATPFFLEVIPLAPVVSARTPTIALTGVLSGLALRDLLAVPSYVFGARLAG
jgi:hypothetical protein